MMHDPLYSRRFHSPPLRMLALLRIVDCVGFPLQLRMTEGSRDSRKSSAAQRDSEYAVSQLFHMIKSVSMVRRRTLDSCNEHGGSKVESSTAMRHIHVGHATESVCCQREYRIGYG